MFEHAYPQQPLSPIPFTLFCINVRCLLESICPVLYAFQQHVHFCPTPAPELWVHHRAWLLLPQHDCTLLGQNPKEC